MSCSIAVPFGTSRPKNSRDGRLGVGGDMIIVGARLGGSQGD